MKKQSKVQTDTQTLYEKEEIVKKGRYKLQVHSFEYHQKGDGSGRDEGMPGNFLEQKVILLDCNNPISIESIAVERKVVLHKYRKETSSEPEDYSELKHKDLVKRVKQDPELYIRDLQRIVKKIL